MRILVTGTLPEHQTVKLRSLGFDVSHFGHEDLIDEPRFVNAIADAAVYISGGYETATPKVLESASHLKLIVFLGADYSPYIDVPTAQRRGITIANTPGTNSNSVAEFTIALLLAAVRRIPAVQEAFRAGNWSVPTTHDLKGRTLGLVGYGNVGSKVAKIASLGFGMNVIFWTRTPERLSAEKPVGRYCEQDELFRRSNFVSLHIPAEASFRLTDRHFAAMPAGSVLVSTSPAQLVEPASLLKALTTGTLAAAAFDGFYHGAKGKPEGVVKDLLALPSDKLIVTPHAAWRTTDTDNESYNAAISHIVNFFGKPV